MPPLVRKNSRPRPRARWPQQREAFLTAAEEFQAAYRLFHDSSFLLDAAECWLLARRPGDAEALLQQALVPNPFEVHRAWLRWLATGQSRFLEALLLAYQKLPAGQVAVVQERDDALLGLVKERGDAASAVYEQLRAPRNTARQQRLQEGLDALHGSRSR